MRYSLYLDYDLGPFDFGELGLFTASGDLFALGAWSVLQQKLKLTSTDPGNSIRIDAYLSMVGQNYYMWLDLAESNNQFHMAVFGSVDQLPPSKDAVPNAYVISGASTSQSAFQAYTDRIGLWNFDTYAYANTHTGTITGFDNQSVTIDISEYVPADMDPAYFGQLILEFSTGQLFGICRYVEATTVVGSTVRFTFQTPIAITPVVGDKFVLFSRQALSVSSLILPVATSTTLGAIKVGPSLTITPDGILDVAPASYPVTSVNGKTGAVVLVADDISGISLVGKTGQYTDLIGYPTPYSLPIATSSTLGGVKAPATTDHLQIAGDGTIDLSFDPVKSVNGQLPDATTGDVALTISVPGLNNATPFANGDDLNTFVNVGIYYAPDSTISDSLVNAPGVTPRAMGVLEVLPYYTGATAGTNDVVQRWSNGSLLFFRRLASSTWGPWVSVSTSSALPIATTTTLGAVIIGAGLSVTGLGVLSANVASVNGYTNSAIVLNANDVGAVPLTQKRAFNGVAELDGPTGPSDPSDDYVYGRILFDEVPFNAWQTQGTWDASTNHVNGDTNTSLDATGKATINVTPDDTPTYQSISVPGFVYRVSVAGTTSLDGTSSWAVGDLVLSIGGAWQRVGSSSLPIATTSVLGGVKIGNGIRVAGDGTISTAYIIVNSTGASPTAAGTNAVAIGQSAIGAAGSGVAIGPNANAAASSTNGIAIGSGASASGTSVSGIAIGVGAALNLAANGIAIGTSAAANASGAVAIGNNSTANVADTVSVGSAGTKRKVVNVARGAAANEALTWDQVGTDFTFASGVFGLAGTYTGTWAVTGAGTYTGTVTAADFTATSDRRLKQILGDLTDEQAIIVARAIRVRHYKFLPTEKETLGVIADELEELLPMFVHEADDEMRTKSVNYAGMAPIALQAAGALSRIIDAQAKLIGNLSGDVQALAHQLRVLASKVEQLEAAGRSY